MHEETDPGVGQGVSWTLFLWSVGLVLALVAVIYTMSIQRLSNIEDRLLRAESVIANRGERIALLESGRGINETNIHLVEKRVADLELRMSALELSLAAHRAATERGGR